MFSLSYTSAYDPYHTVFRFLVLLSFSPEQSLSYRTVRTSDFFLCFPNSLKDVTSPRDIENFAKDKNALVKLYSPNQYDRLPNDRIIFERMEIIHAAAVSALSGEKLIDKEAWEQQIIKLFPQRLSGSLQEAISNFQTKNEMLVDFLSTKLSRVDVLGKNGLFARTGLGDHQYDDL